MTTAEDFPAIWADLVTRWVAADAESAEFPEITPRSKSLLQQLSPVVLVNGIAVLTAPAKWVRTETEKKISGDISEVLTREVGIPVTLSLSVKETTPDSPLEMPAEDTDAPPSTEEPEVERASVFGDLPPVPPGPVHTPDLWENISDAGFPASAGTDASQVSAAPAERPALEEASVPVATIVPTPTPATAHADDENRLNPKYTFETFVTGPSNQFPATACRVVAENPGKAYNPLFIYGQPGLGKTHLLHAIGHYAQELRPKIRVRYVSSEEMTNEFINAIQGGPLALDQFKRNYRNLDLLIVDDIQFLQGKESTQEEFFHTFNALYQANHQIVLSSDRPPSQLTTLEDRLRTRFEGGLTTDVKTPDLETRMAILAKKSLLNGAVVPPDVLEFIASRNESSIRELEGALTRVVAYCSMTGEPITISAAEVVVKDILPQDVKITAEMVIEVISEHFSVSLDQLTGPSKVRKIVTARQFGMFLTREYCEMSTTNIGKVYGGRDHTTVMHAEKKMRKSIQENTVIFEQFQELTQKIKSRARQR
ncbi:chromosomal replication initiator protein DnaA [Corynebacterium terpenotabidum]|uniref:Chromosomal replication initiator protein DnaA n=1 Tax=Corynebacterium terpenotabidum Y-11 TaxID=1200352 RepID=S4XB20_9CORY|nr:chromosomal replication initiator protein DnaA [Corynebacterium terpenotabidum]AGP29659.1 chromosomal replication initiation protein [Corynebacterium terpenotabidum Y-11]